MPKKFQGENSKAAVAKARKSAVREAESEKKQKETEDAYWADDDKHNTRKQQRKDEKDKKKAEQLEKKAVAKQLLEEEYSAITTSKSTLPGPKITRAQISAIQEKIQTESPPNESSKKNVVDMLPLVENLNRLTIDGDEARTVDEAIAVLDNKEVEVDRHPEKRMKAAYAQFEATQLPLLKAENPNLRLSQLKQMLKKEWMKSPSNPMNQLILNQ